MASVRRCPAAATQSCASASASADVGNGAIAVLRPALGNAGASAGSVTKGDGTGGAGDAAESGTGESIAAAVPADWATGDIEECITYRGELYAARVRHPRRAARNDIVAPWDNRTMPSDLPRRRRIPPYVLLTLAPLFWACNWIAGRGLAHEIPPLAMTFYRWLFAVIILAPFALPRVRRDWPLIRRHWRVLVPLGAIGIGSHNALAYMGLNYTTATSGVILNSFIPVMIVAMAWVFLRERLSPMRLAGVLVSLTGVLTIISQGSLEALAAFRLNGGDLLVILSMAMWSLYTIGLRYRPPGLDTIAFLFTIACVGELVVLPFYLGEMAFGRSMVWTLGGFFALVAVALFSSVLAYIFWNRGVEEMGAPVAGLFVHLMPVFGVVLAWLFLGERLMSFHLAGIALILAGIVITSRRTALPIPAAPD
jgi:drug/metabolite transporter (DMT)-like permease